MSHQQHGQLPGQDEPQREPQAEEAPPFWEWVMAGIGLLLLIASLTYFGYHALVEETQTPEPLVEVWGVEKQGDRFVVLLRATNRSRSAAADVKVEASLERDGQVVEQGETEFQYLPGESSREGGLFFSRNPAEFEVKVKAKSFRQP